MTDDHDYERLAERTEFDRVTLEAMSGNELDALAATVEDLGDDEDTGDGGPGSENNEAAVSMDESTVDTTDSAGQSHQRDLEEEEGRNGFEFETDQAPVASGGTTAAAGESGGNTAAVGGSTTRGPSAAAGTTDVPSGDSQVLGAEDLQVSYGQVTALQGIDFHIDEGELVALIGPNGAGKTTFSDTAAGHLDYEGSIRFRGREVRDVGRTGLVERGMIYCTEERNLFDYMNVEDNLRLGGFLEDDDAVQENIEFVYDLFPRLEERREQEARSMSGGEQQMLAIGRALMGNPDLLVLDEPTLGLAPVILQDISEALDPIRAKGVSILLTEQNVTFALEHADRIYLLENGQVVKTGTPEEMKGDDYIRESYLGG